VRIKVVLELQCAVLICCNALTTAKAKQKSYYELVSTVKIRTLPVPILSHSHHSTPEKRRQKNQLQSSYLPSTPIIHSTVPFHTCFKSCSQMSDRYRDPLWPQATRFTCLVALKFKHKPFKSECQCTKKQDLWKNNRNICVTRNSSHSNGAKRISENYS